MKNIKGGQPSEPSCRPFIMQGMDQLRLVLLQYPAATLQDYATMISKGVR